MSVDLHVFYSRALQPSPEQWSRAVQDAGFPLEIDIEVDLGSFSGFLPCKYQGKDAGFEYGYQVLAGSELTEYGIGDPERPVCVTFSTHSNFREFASSLVASAVLCSLTDGVLLDEDGETQISAAHVLDWAREGEASLQDHIARQEAEPARTAESVQVAASAFKKPWWKLW